MRQWQILQAIDATPTGVSVRRLARERRVHPRTIRRDIDALERAGFPVYCDRQNGTALYKLNSRPFRRLARTGLGLAEVCALYMGRSIVDALAVAPFREPIASAIDKLQDTLPDSVRRFLDDLPTVLQAQAGPGRKKDAARLREIVPRLIDTSLDRKRARMTYHSFSSHRVKTYIVEPYRLAYAQGGIYLIAFVPEYGQMRTFAVERIRTYAETGERFAPKKKGLTDKPFAHSIGVHTGEPTRVEIAFDASIADYVLEREWHASQRAETRSDGSVALTLEVCIDPALRSWILSFGPLARVVSPRALAEEILEELEEAREKYAPRMDFDARPSRPGLYDDATGRLPFGRVS